MTKQRTFIKKHLTVTTDQAIAIDAFRESPYAPLIREVLENREAEAISVYEANKATEGRRKPIISIRKVISMLFDEEVVLHEDS